jgi:adenosylcobinamide-phosphate synthase
MTPLVSVIIALLLDFYCGEPRQYHPLVGFGRLVSWAEQRSLNLKASPSWQKGRGILAWFLLVIPFSALIYALEQNIGVKEWLSPIILYFCLAPTSLKQHSRAVFEALQQHDLILARQKVALLVSRETMAMDEIAVRRATIESVLENGADAVFAPLFWFLVAGAAGAIFYRLSNTLDAMWGYKTPRYVYFGWAAARIDDGLNWLPARLTALSYALLGHTRQAFRCWQNQAHLLDSPNAGVVMTAGAGALNLQLGGAARYHGQLKQKPLFGGEQCPENAAIQQANTLINKTLWLWLLVLCLCSSSQILAS